MTADEAQRFAEEWIAAWNSHDLDRILSHYADGAIFLSPRAEQLTGSGCVEGRDALRAYWGKALPLVPDLHFTLISAFAGAGVVTILYANNRGQQVTESAVFDASGMIALSHACYRDAERA